MLPRVILHNAVSVDGRVDWFTPDVGLYYELLARWDADVHLAGSRTIFDPAAEPPPGDGAAGAVPEVVPAGARPLLAVPDSRGLVRNWDVLRRMPYWRDHVALCSRATDDDYLAYLHEQHVSCVVAGDDHVDLGGALSALHAHYDARTVVVDSGGTLNGVLLRAGLVDEVSLLVHPCLVGGTSPRSMFRAPDLTAAGGVLRLHLAHVEALRDEIVWLRYDVLKDA